MFHDLLHDLALSRTVEEGQGMHGVRAPGMGR
jgi:hypothetical protein